jgi:glycosyltransferase involved in cell wall biosynthesis
MKILFCIKTLDYKHGGPVEIIININKVINRKEKITYTLEYKKLSYSFLIKSIFNSKLKKKLNNFLYKYDIVHFHEIFSFKVIILSFFLRNLQKKYLFVGHGYLDKWSLNNNYWKKFLFRIFFLQRSIDGSSAFFFSTVAEYREALINYNIKKNNVFVIPNGIDLEVFADFEKKKLYFLDEFTKKKVLIC